MKRNAAWMLVAMSITFASGCASVRSAQLADGVNRDPSERQGGLVYYLPTQLFELTLTVSEKTAAPKKDAGEADGATQAKPQNGMGAQTVDALTADVSLKATPAMADTGRAYVAQFRRNHAGINKMVVRTNANGLLTGNFVGSTTSQLSDTLKALAASAAQVRSSFTAPDLGPCSKPGIYKWVFGPSIANDVQNSLAACGLTVAIARSSAGLLDTKTIQPDWKGVKSGVGAGFFYRQKLPFIVKITHGTRSYLFYEAIAGEHSPVEFMPIPKALFATVSWKIDFVDGIPTMYDLDASGDYLGFFKLPADIIGAYSDAIAAGFNQDKAALKSEQEFLDQAAKLAASQAKYEACRAAAQGGDPEKIKTACN